MSAISSSVKPKKTRAFAVLEAMLAHVHDEPDVGHWPGLRKGMPFAMVVLPALLRGQRDAGLQKSLQVRFLFVIQTGRLQDTSRRQLKVFRCSSFSKMLPRCGRVAHICEAN